MHTGPNLQNPNVRGQSWEKCILEKLYVVWTCTPGKEPQDPNTSGLFGHNTWVSLTVLPGGSWWPWASHLPFLGFSLLILNKGE